MELNQTSNSNYPLIGNRQYTNYLPLEQELSFKKDKNYLFSLSYLTGLSLIGQEAGNFLQGQISCNVKEVQSNTMRQGALCNLKGRILALADVIAWKGLELIIPEDLAEATENTLIKPALLSRVKIEKANYSIYGIYLGEPDKVSLKDLPSEHLITLKPRFSVWQNEKYYCYSLGNQFYILITQFNTQGERSSFEDSFGDANQLKGSLAWHCLRLQQKQFEIYPETRGEFLPHRADLHLSGYINFDKGCYKGQEIIARTHYKATLKHGLKLFTITLHRIGPPRLGEKLLDEKGITLGEIIDYSPALDGSYLILTSILFEHPLECFLEEGKETILLSEFKGG